MDRKLLDLLCCPATRQPLALLTADELAAVNRGIAAGGISRIDGTAQQGALDAGLITRDRRTIYRVDDGIPVLLVDEGLAASQWPDLAR
ncbi:Trm112 family protein [Arenimonas composti]|uniref:Trm112 family protein n=1 Tax=Arenimonas composti TR7-09 = DSM 18010 TaxID=1121013 RepID=A0A091BHA9_9GAMM|nr:Trm112 family protein [Arenimonas composti]KFN51141.1 hypothetical protein P873_04380 [Arenimonas composti TR7-09 = DSM 18010]